MLDIAVVKKLAEYNAWADTVLFEAIPAFRVKNMTPYIEKAEYLGGYRLRLSFADGKVGELNLEPELWGEVFEPLKDVSVFKNFRVDEELRTIVWPTGADLSPEFLYANAA